MHLKNFSRKVASILSIKISSISMAPSRSSPSSIKKVLIVLEGEFVDEHALADRPIALAVATRSRTTAEVKKLHSAETNRHRH